MGYSVSMTHRLLPALVLLAAAASLGAQQQVRVSTERQLPGALRSNTTVTLAAGKYLTSEVGQNSNPAVSWEETFDGRQLVVTGVSGLTLKAAQGAARGATLLAEPRYSYTLVFRRCRDLRLEGLTLGHTEAGECEGGVLRFEGCTNVQVQDCDMFGSGVVGLDLEECTGVTVRGSTIRDCTAGALWAADVQNLRFENVRIAGNEGWPLVSIEGSTGIVFDSCTIEDNTGDSLFRVSGDSKGVSLPRTTIRGNSTDALLSEDSVQPDFSNTAFLDNDFADEQEDAGDCECEDGYGQGWEAGYQKGYEAGYEEGYADALSGGGD
jgi:polygalacturonase